MQKGILFVLLALFTTSLVHAQFNVSASVQYDSSKAMPKPQTGESVYKIKPAIDIPLTLGTAGLSVLGFSKIYSKESTVEEAIWLKKEDVNSFDRWAVD